jgi:hypothetical protein
LHVHVRESQTLDACEALQDHGFGRGGPLGVALLQPERSGEIGRREQADPLAARRRLAANAVRRVRIAKVRNDLHGWLAETRAEIVGVVEHRDDAFVDARRIRTGCRERPIRRVDDGLERAARARSIGKARVRRRLGARHPILAEAHDLTRAGGGAQRLPIGARAVRVRSVQAEVQVAACRGLVQPARDRLRHDEHAGEPDSVGLEIGWLEDDVVDDRVDRDPRARGRRHARERERQEDDQRP